MFGLRVLFDAARPYRVYAVFYDGLDQTFQSGRQVLGQTISRRQLVMATPRASRSSSRRDERWEGVSGLTCMLGDVWWFCASNSTHLSIFFTSRASVPCLHLHATCNSFVREDRRCPDLEAESRTGCWGSLGANEPSKCASATGPNDLGYVVGLPSTLSLVGVLSRSFVLSGGFLVSGWPRASCSSSHDVGPHCKLSCCAWFCLLVAVACLAGRWCFWLLFSCFSWRWCSSLVWGLRVFFFRACGPPGRLSQRQLPGVDRNGVFTEAARYICHLSRVWANGVLDLGDGFWVLNPMGFFTEAVRCGNCEARCTHGARARTQEPNLPRTADKLHV